MQMVHYKIAYSTGGPVVSPDVKGTGQQHKEGFGNISIWIFESMDSPNNKLNGVVRIGLESPQLGDSGGYKIMDLISRTRL